MRGSDSTALTGTDKERGRGKELFTRDLLGMERAQCLSKLAHVVDQFHI